MLLQYSCNLHTTGVGRGESDEERAIPHKNGDGSKRQQGR